MGRGLKSPSTTTSPVENTNQDNETAQSHKLNEQKNLISRQK